MSNSRERIRNLLAGRPVDRITNGLQPACVTACPTGALEFGKRDDIIKLAKERVAAIKGRYPDARLSGDHGDVTYMQVLHLKDDLFDVAVDMSKKDSAKYASRRDLLSPKKAAGLLSKLFS